ncbi:2-amino-4-hydroxy-6-hydroxymethyldihydropteridine diphosphokinase [Cyanobium sp. Morenito 9A2]|uniref:2-amino-4-hydroxy-6- hydroxymethyldihydropteridine diphosphokinase n=1 Tax=Cyanobium sp. Morenito 9A2 TaxID=2823718 RepID=UPI0020CFCA7A|nr:2-amino-4-hydroxy-6-hydroxymethyldihydropteridine diphosphokinase [Cyanobium sp. Morenito 9A2]MCP9849594.1 2-amino-4-hydroxy-6-hydroxymethyldihydropteridine diphosphokinase [Cyanobium sp. Morenito 9A2]
MGDRPVDVRASLADQTLAIGLGANLGDPLATLVGLRPLLEQRLEALLGAGCCRWSPLFRTAPVGGPPGQPVYLNAALVADLPEGAHGCPDPLALLKELLALERRFGRLRRERWGPRHLDLDLLWCGPQRLSLRELELPHPRLLERAFVLAPLVAIDPQLQVPGAAGPVADRLAALPPEAVQPPPEPLPGREDWPEGEGL